MFWGFFSGAGNIKVLHKWKQTGEVEGKKCLRQAYLIVAEGSFLAQYSFCVIIFKGIRLRLMVKTLLSQHATLAFFTPAA